MLQGGVVTPYLAFGPPGAVMDATGAPLLDDAIVINYALQLYAGRKVLLAASPTVPAQVLTPFTIPASTKLDGYGAGSLIVPKAGFTGAEVALLGGNDSEIAALQIYGGSTNRAANPAVNAIGVASGIARCYVTDMTSRYVNGDVLLGVPAGAVHLHVRRLVGEHNAAGVSLAAGSSQPAQVRIGDLDLQNCETGPALYAAFIEDLAVTDVNASVPGGATSPVIWLEGGCQTGFLKGIDIGAGGAGPVMHLDNLSATGPSDFDFDGGTVQGGTIGVLIDGGTRLRFRGIMSKGNSGDGWQVNNTGQAITIANCAGNTNGGSGGYDVNITSTAHVGLFGFAYCSTGATAARNITAAGNHVTDQNPTFPGGLGTAGNAPAGW